MTPSDAIFWWGFACGVGASFVMSGALFFWLCSAAPVIDFDPTDEAHGDYPHVPERK